MQDDLETPQDFDYETRYTLLGLPASGKTTFRMRCADDAFLEAYVPTVGVDESQRVCKLNDDSVVMMLHLADGPGTGSNATISGLLKHSDGICLVFDFTQRATFDALAEILEGARTVAGKNLPVVVVGTKHEDGEERTVSQSEIDEFVAQIGAAAFFAVSSRDGTGIEEAVAHMAKTHGSAAGTGRPARKHHVTKSSLEMNVAEESKEPVEHRESGSLQPTKSFTFKASAPLIEIVQSYEEVTARRMELVQQHLANFDKDLDDEETLRKFRAMLDNGIQVIKYHRNKHGEPASRFLWLDSRTQRLCLGKFEGQKDAAANSKSIALSDIAEIRLGAESYAFMASSKAPPIEHEASCISIVGTNRTFDLSLYPQGPATMLAKALKALVDNTLSEEAKRARGKLGLKRAKTITRRTGPLTNDDLATFEYFKDVLVKGITVMHHTKNVIAFQKILWLDPHTARLNVARFKNSGFWLPEGLYLIDISEIRPGRNADVFQHEVYTRRTVTGGMCLSIIGSETTLCLSFVTPNARDMFMHKLQGLLRAIRPDTITY